jgi:hypothetical protein
VLVVASHGHSSARTGADVPNGTEVTYAHLSEAERVWGAVGVRVAFGIGGARGRNQPCADLLSGVSGVDSFGTEAIRVETRPAVCVAGQTTGAVGAEGAGGALAIGTQTAECAVVAHVLAFTDIGAADLILRTGAAALVIGNAGALTVLAPSRTSTGPLLTNLTALTGGGALPALTGLTIAAGSAIRNRSASALLA